MLLGYTLDIDLGDLCALHNAVQPYLEVCRQEVAAGNAFPFQGDLERLERIMKAVALSEVEFSQNVPPKKGSSSGSA
jgi:hypothetical protein